MSYFYVKSGGTRTTGGGTTKQTGSFATLGAGNTYETIAAAISDGAGSGDFICVSDATSGVETTGTFNGPVLAKPVNLICVDDSNVDQATIASSNQTNGGDNFFTGRWYIEGMYLKASDDIGVDGSGAAVLAKNCTFEVTGSADRVISVTFDGCMLIAIGCTFKGASGSTMNVSNGSCVELYNCATDTISNLFEFGFVNGGGRLKLQGNDLSSVTNYLLNNVGDGGSADDQILVEVDSCQLSASLIDFSNEDFDSPDKRLIVTRSASSSAAAEHQFHVKSYGGEVNDDTTIYRDESRAFPSGEKASFKVETNADADYGMPFWFDLGGSFFELSNASSDTIRIYVASQSALTDIDFWAEISYADGTNNHVSNFLSSRNSDPLATTGTALSTDSGSDWRDGASALSGYNEYYIDLDTSVDPGADQVINIKFFTAKPSATIHIGTTFDAVA